MNANAGIFAEIDVDPIGCCYLSCFGLLGLALLLLLVLSYSWNTGATPAEKSASGKS